jgi:ribonuclease HI
MTYKIVCYTDGSCTGNRNVRDTENPSGFGVFVGRDDNESVKLVAELYGPVSTSPSHPLYLGAEYQSNNTAELTAIGEAFLYLSKMIDRNPDGKLPPVTIFYDSEYAAKSVRGIFNGKKNKKLIKRIREIYQHEATRRGGRITWTWVKGHGNNEFNNRADTLANLGAAGLKCLVGRYAPVVEEVAEAKEIEREEEDGMRNGGRKVRARSRSPDQYHNPPLNQALCIASPASAIARISSVWGENSVVIGEVDTDVTPRGIKSHFGCCGRIKRVSLHTLEDYESCTAEGYATIEFFDEDAMLRALALNKSAFMGKELKVSKRQKR